MEQPRYGKIILLNGTSSAGKELELRELQRGDRGTGDARRDMETVHSFRGCDFEVDSTLSAERNAEIIIAAWKARRGPSVFEMMGKPAK